VRRLLVVDERSARHDTMLVDLRGAGFDVTTAPDAEPIAAIIVAVDALTSELPACARAEQERGVPVIVVIETPDPETRLRAAIDGAVQCVAAHPAAVAQAVDVACAAGAPTLAEQKRRARIEALEALARSETAVIHRRVHLTRLEHGPVRTLPTGPATAAARLALCTPRQRELLDIISREGSVTRAALALGTSRSSVYAALRRIAHRLQLRDSGDLLRLIGAR
jgi:DNA-binding CsgD family transcriptional regulator